MTNWAIVVGINNYKNLTNLKYAKRDAEVMATWLKSKAGFEEVFLFTNGTKLHENTSIPTEPTYGDLRGFLGRQFEQPKLEQSDNLWFFFSGHGVRRGDGDYLMLSDSLAIDVLFTALSVNYVTERLRRCGAGNVVMFFDACRNEGKDGLGFGTEAIEGIITYYSCQAQQRSWEIDDLQHGAFTYALWEFLNSGSSPCITVERLEQYLSKRVPQINEKYDTEVQNPYARIEPISKRKLILFGIPQAADIKALKGYAKDAERDEDWESAQQLWRQVNILTKGLDDECIKALIRIGRHIQQGKSRLNILPPPPQTLAENSYIVQLPDSKSTINSDQQESQANSNPSKNKKQKNLKAFSRIYLIVVGLLFTTFVVFLFAKAEEIKCGFLIKYTNICREKYYNKKYKFKIKYPSDWHKNEPKQEELPPDLNSDNLIVVFYPKNNDNAEVRITVHKKSKEQTLDSDSLSDYIKEYLTQEKNYELCERTRSIDPNINFINKFMDVIFSNSKRNKFNQLSCKTKRNENKTIFLTLNNDDVYIILYEFDADTEKRFRAIVENVFIKSFAFTDYQ